MFVRPDGGKLVYSTCSLLMEENERVVRMFEQSDVFDGFVRWNFDPIRVKERSDGVVIDAKPHNTLTLLPTEMGSDGFFVARWKKTEAL